MELTNRVIVITGASRGLGRATALRLSRKTPHLVLIARDISLLRQVQKEIAESTGHEPMIVQCDVSSESNVERMAALVRAKYSRVDVLINNAGIGTYRVSENLSNEEMRRHFEVNFFGAYYYIKVLLPLLKQSDEGYVLNVGSLFSRVALAENSVYAATKFALAGFSEGLRGELKPYNVGVGLFMPGAMNTSFQAGRDEEAVKSSVMMEPEQAAEAIEKMIAGRKESLAKPAWMLTALRLKQSFA